MWNLKNKTNEEKNENRLTYTENKQVVAGGGRGELGQNR